jgi:hypothetical protein
MLYRALGRQIRIPLYFPHPKQFIPSDISAAVRNTLSAAVLQQFVTFNTLATVRNTLSVAVPHSVPHSNTLATVRTIFSAARTPNK